MRDRGLKQRKRYFLRGVGARESTRSRRHLGPQRGIARDAPDLGDEQMRREVMLLDDDRGLRAGIRKGVFRLVVGDVFRYGYQDGGKPPARYLKNGTRARAGDDDRRNARGHAQREGIQKTENFVSLGIRRILENN